MSKVKSILVLCLISLSAISAEIKQVVIISIDGFREDFLHKEEFPALKGLYLNQKPYIKSSKAVLPSITLINHASMLSGVGPDKHQISWNEWKPELGLIQVPTIFDLARINGYKSAMIVGKKKFQHLNKSVDTFILKEYQSAQTIIEAAMDISNKGQYAITFIHFPGPDGMGHKHGWGSKQYISALIEADEAIGLFLNWLQKQNEAKSTAIIITSDHGGHDKGHGSDSKEDTIVPWILKTPSKLKEIKNHVNAYDTAASAAALLQWKVPLNWSWEGLPVYGF